jgi:gliding motility-associated-like protein
MLLLLAPLLLTAQNSVINPQTQQFFKKSNKTQFFIENKGQWPKQVKFMARLAGMNCWITDSGVVYDYYRIDRNYSPDSLMLMPPNEKDEFERINTSCKGHILRMDYTGINLNAEKHGIDKRETFYNYFIGNDSTKWASFVGLFGEVLVKDAYPGIDIRYYFDIDQIRYDYLVKPGADISQISFRLTGENDVAINENGELLIKIILGVVKHGKLYAYQLLGNEKKEVSCSFERNEYGSFKLKTSDYEKSLALFIDPMIWSTYLGGSSGDDIRSLTIDQYRCVYVTGNTNSLNFPIIFGSYQANLKGNTDVYVSKINSSGNALIFSTYLGGGYSEDATSIKVDQNGNIFTTGWSFSFDFPTTSSAFQPVFDSAIDAYIVKLNPSGSSLIYSTYLGGKETDKVNHIAIDANGFAYIVGGTGSKNFPTTSGAYQTTAKRGGAFVSKLNQNGSGLVYSTYIADTNGNEEAYNIRVDSSGYAYIVGNTTSNNFPITSGAYQTIKSGGQDCFISKLNPQGTSLMFSTFLGGSLKDYCYDIALLGSSGFVVVGYTPSTNFPTTSGAFKTIFGGGISDGFISQFNSTASTLVYSSYLGGNSYDGVMGIVIDSYGNKLLSGYTGSINYPTTACAYQTTYGGGEDAVITKMNPDLSAVLYSTFIGGNSSELSENDIALDNNNCVYVGAWTFSTNFPTTPNAYMPSFIGGTGLSDGYIIKLDTTINSVIPNTVNGSPFCAGSSISVSYFAPCKVDTGNVFTVQLSDSIGGFGNPVTIGTLSTISSGTINCKIPLNTNYGTGYRIRVNASKPYVIGHVNDSDITITSIPKAGFSVNDSAQCLSGNNFVFTNTSTISHGSMQYKWHFGDNLTDSIINPAHSYTTVDSFIVQMIAESDNGCKDTIYDTILTYPMPKADFTISDSTQCLSGNSFNLNNNSSGATAYIWNFGDYTTDTATNPIHTYKSTGVFIIKLIATNKEGCPDSMVKTIRIFQQPLPSFTLNDSGQCLKGNSFVFTNYSTISKGNFTSQWKFGDGNGSVSNNSSHIYSTDDTFSVVLILVSDSGCSDSIIKKVIVYPQPKAHFFNYDSSQCLERNNFAFLNNCTIKSGTMTYLWKFGDGDTSTKYRPDHEYSVQGVYTVTIIATSDQGCNDSFQKRTHIHVHPEPRSQFTVNDTTQCLSGNNFLFTNNSTISAGTFSQRWEFGDGDTINTFNSSHIYVKSDTFFAKLLLISDWACKDSILKQIIVHHEQTTDFNVADTIVCIGEVVNFNNLSTYNYGTLSYSWDFGDGKTTVTPNPQHSFTSDGIYIVKLISVSNFGCKDSVYHKIYVYPNPKTDFTINDPSQCLLGNSFTFTDNSSIKTGSIVQYYFDLGDGANSSMSIITHNYASVGNYIVKLVIKSDQGCPDSLIKQVYVNPMPIAGFSINLNPQNLIGNNFIFTSTSTIPSGNLNYLWDFGDGDTSSKSSPSHSYTKTGRYIVQLLVLSDYGCADTFIDTAIIRFPNINISLTLPDGCVGFPVYFKNKSTVNPPDSFLNFIWDYGDGNQAIIYDDPQHIYYSAGSYIINFVCLTAFGNKDTLVDTIEISPSPIIDITAVPDSILIPGSSVTLKANGVFDQLLWNDNSTNTSIIVQKSGKYWVTASFITGCKSSDTIWLVDGEKKEIEIVTVFTPNGDGYNDYFVIKDIKNFQPVKLAIYNRWGDELYSSSDYQNKWDGTYKGKHLPEGTYYYILETKDGKVYKGAVNILR